MALADSHRAIGAVTQLLIDHLVRRTQLNIVARHPREAATSDSNPKLNLFLYETSFDASLKNQSLQEGQPAPLWLVLKYVLTAYDTGGHSDTPSAHELMGQGLAGLQEVNYLRLDNHVALPVRRALENNPEALKVTFDAGSPDLISKLMQGPDETYRFSMAFQVRPVMIVPGELPNYNLLVGVNYEATPPAIIGEEGVQLEALASMGPVLESLEPGTFEASASEASAPLVEIRGVDLHLSGLECLLGTAPVPIVSQRTDRLAVRIGSALASGSLISAGEHPLRVRQLLSNGRFRSSNLLAAALQPRLQTVATALVVNPGPPATVTGTLTLAGNLLGTEVDDIQVAFHQNGAVVRMIDVSAPASNQTSLAVALPTTPPLQAGTYRLILRVNGQQARLSPTVVLA